MRGLLTGLLYLAYGIFRGVGIIFFHFYYPYVPIHDHAVLIFYVVFVAVASLGLIAYIIVAYLYKHRQRPAVDGSEEEVIRRVIASNVFGH